MNGNPDRDADNAEIDRTMVAVWAAIVIASFFAWALVIVAVMA